MGREGLWPWRVGACFQGAEWVCVLFWIIIIGEIDELTEAHGDFLEIIYQSNSTTREFERLWGCLDQIPYFSSHAHSERAFVIVYDKLQRSLIPWTWAFVCTMWFGYHDELIYLGAMEIHVENSKLREELFFTLSLTQLNNHSKRVYDLTAH